MKPLHDQSCPLCQKNAKYRFADYENRKHFICDQCTEYQISNGAEKRLSESIPQWKGQMSVAARSAKEGTVLVILLASDPKQEGVANPAFDTTYVARSELPS